jgi:hypothetical protein|tara:strand:- start:3170 stop:4372 length:1203 start_codon:yes stop_codon:yes gene_type:complete
MRQINQKINKFTILGAGTAGCLTASFIKKHTNAEVEWIFDSNTPAQSVGEGSTIPLATSLFKELGFNYTLLDIMGGSLKKGIRKKDWNGVGDYVHEFPMGQTAIHFNSKMLQKYIPEKLKQKGVDIVDKKVTSHDDIDADYIIDCTGRPSSYEEFNDAEHIAVNAAHIIQSPTKGSPLFDYTFCIARPFGWIFCIPLVGRTSIGYLYNETINNLDEVKKDMQSFMADYNFPTSDNQNNFSFKNYYRKENYSERVAYNGNASFFLEPLEATSVGTIDHVNRRLLDTINLGLSIGSSNDWYENEIKEAQNMIMMHYFAGSKYSNKFWDYAQQKGKNAVAEMVSSNKFRDIASQALSNYTDPDIEKLVGMEYGQWPAYSYLQNFKGLNIAQDIDNHIKDYELK